MARGSPRKGKVRQRLGIAAKAKQKVVPTRFRGSVIKLHATGKLSAADVGTVAHEALTALSSHLPASTKQRTDVNSLAKARPKGTRVRGAKKILHAGQGNSSRDLQRALLPSCHLTEPYKAMIPTWDTSSSSQIMKRFAFYLPHELMECIIPVGEEASTCTITDPSFEGFNKQMAAWGERVGLAAQDLEGHAPIALWGDSAPHTKRDSLFLLTWTFLNGKDRRRYWITCFQKSKLCACGCKGRCTFDAIWDVIAWSMRSCLAKRWPAVDHTGVPFASPTWRATKGNKALRIGAACLAKTGDWQWYKSALGLRGWRGEGPGKCCCWLCRASFNDAHYAYDFSSIAQWRTSAPACLPACSCLPAYACLPHVCLYLPCLPAICLPAYPSLP